MVLWRSGFLLYGIQTNTIMRSIIGPPLVAKCLAFLRVSRRVVASMIVERKACNKAWAQDSWDPHIQSIWSVLSSRVLEWAMASFLIWSWDSCKNSRILHRWLAERKWISATPSVSAMSNISTFDVIDIEAACVVSPMYHNINDAILKYEVIHADQFAPTDKSKCYFFFKNLQLPQPV